MLQAVPARDAGSAAVAPYPPPTPRQHLVLGGEVIRRLQMDSSLRRRPIEQVVRDLIGDDGGPLLSHGQSEAEQRSFDATCRRFFRFLTEPEISRRRSLADLLSGPRSVATQLGV